MPSPPLERQPRGGTRIGKIPRVVASRLSRPTASCHAAPERFFAMATDRSKILLGKAGNTVPPPSPVREKWPTWRRSSPAGDSITEETPDRFVGFLRPSSRMQAARIAGSGSDCRRAILRNRAIGLAPVIR